MARCPAHDDSTASLSISQGDDGRTLVYCLAGCKTPAICAAVRLKLSDLFLDKEAPKATANGHTGKFVCAYDYHDAGGKVVYQVMRFDHPKTFSQRRADPARPGKWIEGPGCMDGVARVLYRLPKILNAKVGGKPVIIAEGEKDVDRIAQQGFTATCNPMGAGKWRKEYSETLCGCDCVIVADKDTPGRAHAQEVAASLYGAAKSVRVIELPDLDGKPVKDAHDYFSAGGDAAGIVALVDATPEWTPPAAPKADQTPVASESLAKVEPPAPKLEIPLPEIDNAAALCADDSITLPPEIIRGVLHQGLKAVLGSNAKARKTWILLDAAISVATGTEFWKWHTVKGPVLYINFEIPRAFIRARIKRLCEVKGLGDVGNLDVWTLRGHAAPFWQLFPTLLDKIKAGNYSLIIVDPIYKGLGGRNENDAGDIGELCNELEHLAVQTGAAVLYAAHFSKGNQASKEAIDRISGSGVFGRDADSLIILTKHETPDAYAVDLILRNLPEQPSFVVQWEYPVMVETELNPAKLKQPAGRKPEHAPEELFGLLPGKGFTNGDFLAAAKEQGIPERSFYRLKKELENDGKILLSKVTGKWTPTSPKNKP